MATIAEKYAYRAVRNLKSAATLYLLSEYGRLATLTLDIQRLAIRTRSAAERRKLGAQWTRAHRQLHAIAAELRDRGYDRQAMTLGGLTGTYAA